MKSGLTVHVPDVFWLMAGFSCKSRAPLSSSSRKNMNCIVRADTTAETALTSYRILDFIRRRRPHLLTLENVKQLMAKPDADTQSDCDQVTGLGRQTHCVCVFERLCLPANTGCLPVFVFADRQTLGVCRRSFCGCLGRNLRLSGCQMVVSTGCLRDRTV